MGEANYNVYKSLELFCQIQPMSFVLEEVCFWLAFCANCCQVCESIIIITALDSNFCCLVGQTGFGANNLEKIK